MASKEHDSKRVLRYRIGQRLIHAMLALSFLILLATGLFLFWGPLSQYAAGGLSRTAHRLGAIIFMAIPIVYLLVDRPGAKELLWDSIHYDRDDLEWFKYMYRYFFGYARDMPPQGRLNAGQKLHHAVVVIFSAGIVLSGLLMWLGRGSMGPNSLALTAMVHDISMLVLTVMLVGHLYFTYVYSGLSAMTSGYVGEEEALLEHSKWVDEMAAEAEAS